ncbi:putative GNAT family acetyltransferase [Leifsonia sp. EB41]|uniref:GNAT family N-acetyltransferase n=1 Tax=Leifsonia sp. EB41 TaxID=3156260 RepID=UPI003514EC29
MEPRVEESRYLLIDRGDDGTQHTPIGLEAYVDVDSGETPLRIYYHTVVSEQYAGKGLASFLVRTVLDDAIAQGRSIVPVCPYIAAWLPKHPEYADHVVRPTSEHRHLAQSALRRGR